jgi:hypothetical protein
MLSFAKITTFFSLSVATMYYNNGSENIHLLRSGFNDTYDGELKKKLVKSVKAIWKEKPFYFLKITVCFLALCISCLLLTELKEKRDANVLDGTFLFQQKVNVLNLKIPKFLVSFSKQTFHK